MCSLKEGIHPLQSLINEFNNYLQLNCTRNLYETIECVA